MRVLRFFLILNFIVISAATLADEPPDWRDVQITLPTRFYGHGFSSGAG